MSTPAGWANESPTDFLFRFTWSRDQHHIYRLRDIHTHREKIGTFTWSFRLRVRILRVWRSLPVVSSRYNVAQDINIYPCSCIVPSNGMLDFDNLRTFNHMLAKAPFFSHPQRRWSLQGASKAIPKVSQYLCTIRLHQNELDTVLVKTSIRFPKILNAPQQALLSCLVPVGQTAVICPLRELCLCWRSTSAKTAAGPA